MHTSRVDIPKIVLILGSLSFNFFSQFLNFFKRFLLFSLLINSISHQLFKLILERFVLSLDLASKLGQFTFESILHVLEILVICFLEIVNRF